MSNKITESNTFKKKPYIPSSNFISDLEAHLGRILVSVELEALLGGLLWVRVLIFALYFSADLCTPYYYVSPCNL